MSGDNAPPSRRLPAPASGEVVIYIFLLDEHLDELQWFGCVLEGCSSGAKPGLQKARIDSRISSSNALNCTRAAH